MATLNGMLSVILPVASRHGLNVRFGSAPASQPGWQCVTCIVSLGDHVETTSLEGPVVVAGAAGGRTQQMTAIQATGSTTTYLKRYLLGMIFSLVLTDEQDDDGEASRGRAYGTGSPPSRPPTGSVAFASPIPSQEAEQGVSGAPLAGKRPTAAQWLDALALETAACDGMGLEAILSRDDVQKAQDRFQNGAKDRLNHIIHEALRRVARQEEAAEGELAADDPFREPVPS